MTAVAPSIDSSEENQRRELWLSLGTSAAETDELLAYGRSKFDHSRLPKTYPLSDEPFVAAWQSYVEKAREVGALAALSGPLRQLRFPVLAGISDSPTYLAATRRGETKGLLDSPGLQLVRPEGVRIFLHQTPAGRVPVLVAEERRDFETLVQALTRRNEPWPVPTSMGACIVSGYNNWGRIAELRRCWEEIPAESRSPPDWETRFAEIVADRSLYQDRFILLSTGPYSAVSSSSVGLDDAEWNRRSLVIRLEHECAHYLTRQVLGSMRNTLVDELIADFMGLVAAEGRFRADWFLRFMGLEDFPRYRVSGRLGNYGGDPPLSPGAFALLRSAVVRAAHNLELADDVRRRRSVSWTDREKGEAIVALSRVNLEWLAREPSQFVTDSTRFLIS